MTKRTDKLRDLQLQQQDDGYIWLVSHLCLPVSRQSTIEFIIIMCKTKSSFVDSCSNGNRNLFYKNRYLVHFNELQTRARSPWDTSLKILATTQSLCKREGQLKWNHGMQLQIVTASSKAGCRRLGDHSTAGMPWLRLGRVCRGNVKEKGSRVQCEPNLQFVTWPLDRALDEENDCAKTTTGKYGSVVVM